MRFKIEYDVKLNDQGRPYIDLNDKEFNGVPEHRFFAVEITRYILYDLLEKNAARSANSKVGDEAMKIVASTAGSITEIANQMANLILGTMNHTLDIQELLKSTNYDIVVDELADLDQIKNGGFVFNDKIYVKKHGLKVKVLETDCVYSLSGELDDEYWVNLTPKKQDDPEK